MSLISVFSFQLEELLVCKAGLVVMNSLRFLLSRNIFISSSYRKDNFVRQNILGWHFWFLLFNTLDMSFYSALTA